MVRLLPSRRLFLSLASALPLFGYAAGPLAGRIRIAVKYQMIDEPKLDIAEKLDLLRKLGFDGTELKTDEKVDTDELKRAIESTGFPVHGIINASIPDIIPGVELAHKLGADSVLVLAREYQELSYRENFDRWSERVRLALPLAEKYGIRLCIENVRATFLKTAEGMAEFIDSFQSPWVRSYFDLGNTITWTEQSAEHWATVLGERIYKLDIKDRGHPEFGEPDLKREGIITGTDGGEVNWKDVRKQLTGVNFEGWATAEVRGGDRTRLKGIEGWMRDVLDLD